MTGASEPARLYWAAGIAVSLLVHTSAVAGAALLAGRYVADSQPTEITFSDEASPVAAPEPSEPEPAPLVEDALPVEQERLVASLAAQPSPVAAAEAVTPLAPDVSRPAQAQALTPEAAETLQANQAPPAIVAQPQQLETPGQAPSPAAQSAETTTAAARPMEPVKADQLSAQELLPSTQPEIPEAPPSTAVAPTVPLETAPESPAETAATPADRDTLAAEQNVENLSSTSTEAAATVLASEPAEAVSTVEQPDNVGVGATVAPDQREPEHAPVGSPPAETALSPPAQAAEAGAAARTETLPPTATPMPSIAETSAAPAAAPQAAQPLAPSTESIASLAPEVLPPSTLPAEPDAGAAAVVPAEPEAVQPVEPPAETALLVPDRPSSSPDAEPDKPADRYRKIVDFVRGYGRGDCFIALPAMDPEGTVTLETFGRDRAREKAFLQALSGIDGLPDGLSGGNVADPQCQALSFAREMKRYPDFSLTIDLDEAAMVRSNTLSGSVRNVNGRELYLLLVDENGLVQSIAPAGDGSVRSFSVRLSQSGQPVDTEQILMAITADPPLKIISVNEAAAKFLPFLARLIANSGAQVDIAVKGFTLR